MSVLLHLYPICTDEGSAPRSVALTLAVTPWPRQEPPEAALAHCFWATLHRWLKGATRLGLATSQAGRAAERDVLPLLAFISAGRRTGLGTSGGSRHSVLGGSVAGGRPSSGAFLGEASREGLARLHGSREQGRGGTSRNRLGLQ